MIVVEVKSDHKSLPEDCKIQPGHLLLKIGDYYTTACSAMNTLYYIHKIHEQNKDKPLHLTFIIPAAPGSKSVTRVRTLEDPSNKFPREPALLLKSHGIHIVMPISGQTVCYWPYCQVCALFRHCNPGVRAVTVSGITVLPRCGVLRCLFGMM